jgi:hypothetical protein
MFLGCAKKSIKTVVQLQIDIQRVTMRQKYKVKQQFHLWKMHVVSRTNIVAGLMLELTLT